MDCVVEFHNEMRIRIDGLERAVEHIMELMRRLPCTSVDLDDVELALHEALANAVVHGNRQDPYKMTSETDSSVSQSIGSSDSIN